MCSRCGPKRPSNVPLNQTVPACFGIIELKNWFSSSSRSATESEVTEALQLLALARMETLSDEQSARCRELGLYEMYISEVVKRARFQTR